MSSPLSQALMAYEYSLQPMWPKVVLIAPAFLPPNVHIKNSDSWTLLLNQNHWGWGQRTCVINKLHRAAAHRKPWGSSFWKFFRELGWELPQEFGGFSESLISSNDYTSNITEGEHWNVLIVHIVLLRSRKANESSWDSKAWERKELNLALICYHWAKRYIFEIRKR